MSRLYKDAVKAKKYQSKIRFFLILILIRVYHCVSAHLQINRSHLNTPKQAKSSKIQFEAGYGILICLIY